jgi:hypothetical protein
MGIRTATNFSERDRSWLVSVRLLDTASRRRRFASGLGCKLLARGLATGGLSSGLLCASHDDDEVVWLDG